MTEVSYYPQVSEWIFLGEAAINMAQVASIEFSRGPDDACAIVRLSTYRASDGPDEMGATWFKVMRPELVRYLRDYARRLAAPGFPLVDHDPGVVDNASPFVVAEEETEPAEELCPEPVPVLGTERAALTELGPAGIAMQRSQLRDHAPPQCRQLFRGEPDAAQVGFGTTKRYVKICEGVAHRCWIGRE